MKFLGFIVDTLFGKFRLTSSQKQKLRTSVELCLQSPSRVPAKLVARVTGLAQSLSLVTGPVSGLFRRYLHRALAQRPSGTVQFPWIPPLLGSCDSGATT